MRSIVAVLIAAPLAFVAGLAVAGSAETVLWPAANLKWVAPPDAPPGIMVASLWGDMKAGGAYGAMVKQPAGLKSPLHTHTASVRGVVVSGTFVVAAEGAQETKLGSGSYFMIPGGWKHTSGCAAGAECVLFQEGDAPFDVVPVNPPAAKPAK